jgi:quercetin dioxygenase-like cupin family protein
VDDRAGGGPGNAGVENLRGRKTNIYTWQNVMKILKLENTNEFTPGAMKRFFLVEDSADFKIINFNLDEGVTFPVHSHDLDGQLSIQVLEGEGFFLGDNDAELPAEKGDILISLIREPHGVRAKTKMRILVTIAPPI